MPKRANFLLAISLTSIATSMWLSSGCSKADSHDDGKPLVYKVERTRFDLVIENLGSIEAAGSNIDVYLNERSTNGFKTSIEFPKYGGTTSVHLDDFAKADGTRFNPNDEVSVIWAGGSGYAFSNPSR